MCIDIVEIRFGIANGQILLVVDGVTFPRHARIFVPDNNKLNISGFLPNLVLALILWRPSLGLQMGKFSQFLTELSA